MRLKLLRKVIMGNNYIDDFNKEHYFQLITNYKFEKAKQKK